MKKLLSMFLALCLLFSLAAFCGCAKAPETEPDTPDAAPQQTPVEDGAAEEEAGVVAIIVPTMAAEQMIAITDQFSEQLSAEGYNPQVGSAELDVAQYVPLMENYLTMDAKLICLTPMDPDGLEDICGTARANGCFITMLSVNPDYEIDGGLTVDNVETGEVTALMLLDFIHKKNPNAADGSIPIAVASDPETVLGLERKQGYMAVLEEDPAVYIAYHQDMENTGVESGFNFVQSAVTTDPSIKYFLCYDVDMLVGANNYITSMIPDANLGDYCVVGAGNTNPEVDALIELSKTDEAAVRGLVVYGGATPGYTLASIASKLLSGAEAAPYWEYEPMFATNTFGYEYSN